MYFSRHNYTIRKLTWHWMKAASSTTAGLVLGMAQTSVMPPASAAAVPVLKSSLCTAPGSLAQVDIGRKPEVQYV
jgi:hypothetical protein